jgi:hypothetical protein
MRYPEAVNYLVEHGVPRRTASRINSTIREQNFLKRVGSGSPRDYSHNLLEALAFYWHPVIGIDNSATPLRNRLRRTGFLEVLEAGCRPQYVIISRGQVALVDVPDFMVDMIRHGYGAAVIPVHHGCNGGIDP